MSCVTTLEACHNEVAQVKAARRALALWSIRRLS